MKYITKVQKHMESGGQWDQSCRVCMRASLVCECCEEHVNKVKDRTEEEGDC